MRFPIRKSIQWCIAVACLTLFWCTSAQAQTIFETQFGEDVEEMIGETEKNVSGEDVAKLLMRSARIQVKGAEEVAEGHLLIVFFGEEGEMLHTVATGALKLELEPPFIELADVMPGDRVVEGFESTLGEYGFRMNDVTTWEPPPIIHAEADPDVEPPPIIHAGSDPDMEPPPIMLESGDVNPEIVKVLWSEVREPGVGVAFVPILGRYIEGDLQELRVHPAMISGELGR
jgi:hypothetical protein